MYPLPSLLSPLRLSASAVLGICASVSSAQAYLHSGVCAVAQSRSEGWYKSRGGSYEDSADIALWIISSSHQLTYFRTHISAHSTPERLSSKRLPRSACVSFDLGIPLQLLVQPSCFDLHTPTKSRQIDILTGSKLTRDDTKVILELGCELD